MLLESLPEMYRVAKYCVEFQKDTNIWPAPGWHEKLRRRLDFSIQARIFVKKSLDFVQKVPPADS